MKNKYYICPNCGELTTEKEILEDISCGGSDMCTCKYTKYYWNEEDKEFDVDYPRIYSPYKEININLYSFLKDIYNDVIRLNYYQEFKDLFSEKKENDEVIKALKRARLLVSAFDTIKEADKALKQMIEEEER